MSDTQKDSDISQTDNPISIQKLQDILSKEVWSRNDLNTLVQAKLFEIDEVIKEAEENDVVAKLRETALEHLQAHKDSGISKYVIGIVSLIIKQPEDRVHLKTLVDQFRDLGKWKTLVQIGQKMLEYGEDRFALRIIVEGMDNGSYPKAKVKEYYARLAKIDRKNPGIAEKYGRSLIDEGDRENGLAFIKKAADAYARAKNQDKLNYCWKYLVDNDPDDLSFFEKIERVLVNQRQQNRAAELLIQLVDYHNKLLDLTEEEDEKAKIRNIKISLLKRILEYNPHYHRARTEIISTYKEKYKDHSLLKEFLQYSELTHTKKDVNESIAEFERNIVFDKDNYVFHKSWGVGRIIDLNQEQIIIDFKNKPGHRMSIQMALKSLKPLEKDHIWVSYFDNEQNMRDLFKEETVEFFLEMLKSYGRNMNLAQIKKEITTHYLSITDWSKWWTKTKPSLKKHPHIGFSAVKKDEVFLREEEISLADELIEKFNAAKDSNKRIAIALEALDSPDETQNTLDVIIEYYNAEEKNKDVQRKIIAYILLNMASEKLDDEDVPRNISQSDMQEIMNETPVNDLIDFSAELKSLEIKKAYIALIKKFRSDYPSIFVQILFEVPIKIHKYIFAELIKEEQIDSLNLFISESLKHLKDYPDVFLWIAKNILGEQWKYDWLKTSYEDLTLRVFRLLRPLAKIEATGTKLKKSAIDILFGNKGKVLTKVITDANESTIRKMYALFREVPYVEDIQKSELVKLVHKTKPDFKWSDEEESNVRPNILLTIPEDEVLLVSEKSLEDRKRKYENLVNVEMPLNSEDIGEAQERGDLRENAEYKAAMEKQQLLQAEMTKMDNEFKQVIIINPEEISTSTVSIGTKILIRNLENNNLQYYTILGVWDADSDNNVVSYKSPLAGAFIGKKKDDTVKMKDSGETFQILQIEKAL